MKKKILLIAVVILVSLGLLSVSKFVQNKYLDKNSALAEQKINVKAPDEVTLKEDSSVKQDDLNSEKDITKEEVKVVDQEKSAKAKLESKTETQQNNNADSKVEVKTTVSKVPSPENITTSKEATKEQVTKEPEPKKEPNFIIKDDISGKIILSININSGNKTVGEITISELDNSGISYKTTGRGEAVYFTMINSLKAREFGPLSGWCFYVNGTKPSVSCGAYKLKSGDVVEWKYLKDGVNN